MPLRRRSCGRPRRPRSSAPRYWGSTSSERTLTRRLASGVSSKELQRLAEVRFLQATRIYPGNAVPAVNGLDLDIKDGEFMVLVGPSGSGKTTALRMVAGLESITDGTIRIGDRVVNTVPPKERDIAMVFQNYALYPHMSVYDN